jgi:FtsP/CotA-like multicopper oxidase with cupredoxin domain
LRSGALIAVDRARGRVTGGWVIPLVRRSADLIMDFTDPIIRGMSLFHCHLLKHKDKGIMTKILFQ